MSDKLLLGLLYVDKKFKSPEDIEELLPHLEKIFKIASQRQTFSQEELYLLKKLLYKVERFEEFLKDYKNLWSDRFKLKGRL